MLFTMRFHRNFIFFLNVFFEFFSVFCWAIPHTSFFGEKKVQKSTKKYKKNSDGGKGGNSAYSLIST